MTKSTGSAIKARVLYLLDHGPFFAYSCRAYGDYGATYSSNNIKQQLGYEAEQSLITPSFWLTHVHPKDRQQIVDHLIRLFDTDYYCHKYRFRNADGEYRWMYDELIIIRDEQGNSSEIIGYWVDITR